MFNPEVPSTCTVHGSTVGNNSYAQFLKLAETWGRDG
mgnify:CR=1 FL=1